MKKWMVLIGFMCAALTAPAQSTEAQQLILNVEKLAQLKSILKNLYSGYEIVQKGYNRIKDISQGNYQLHQAFLDGLLAVSPTVKKYKKVGDILRFQQHIMQEQRQTLMHFKSTGQFTPEEVLYLGRVYNNLLTRSLKNLDDLLLIITANQLRMSDDERLKAIDRIHHEVQESLTFLRSFNNNTKLLSLQRQKEQYGIDLSKRLNGLK